MIDQHRIVGKKSRFAYDPDVMLTDRLDIEGIHTLQNVVQENTQTCLKTQQNMSLIIPNVRIADVVILGCD